MQTGTDRQKAQITENWWIFTDDPFKLLYTKVDGKPNPVKYASKGFSEEKFNKEEKDLISAVRNLYPDKIDDLYQSEDGKKKVAELLVEILPQMAQYFGLEPREDAKPVGQQKSEPAPSQQKGEEPEYIIPKEQFRAREENTSIVAASETLPSMSDMLKMVDLESAVLLFDKFEEAKRKLAKPDDIQSVDAYGKPMKRPFYKKSFWRKAATAFNVFTRVKTIQTYQIGKEWICRVTAEGKWGRRTAEDIGVCSSSEFTGNRKFNFPDLESTATTRAINRVTSDIIGGGEVSAEEVNKNQE